MGVSPIPGLIARPNAVSLRDLHIEPEYRSDRASLAREFFGPLLAVSTRYDRAVGYFVSSSLAVLADGLMPFIERRGAMRVVASPKLTADDADAILSGYADRDEIVAAAVDRTIAEFAAAPDPERQRLECLAWLVKHELLEMKLALVVENHSLGMYHEKIGVFEDSDGNSVAFIGSANESYGGMVANFESVDVYCSWLERDRDRAEAKRDAFQRLWREQTRGVTVLPFPEASRRRLIQIAPPSGVRIPELSDGIPERSLVERSGFGFPSAPTGFGLRDYQGSAVDAWIAAGGQGIFAMATGTGKTLTAMGAVSRVASLARQQEHQLLVIVVCPLKHLVEQWAEDAEFFGINPVRCFEARDAWKPDVALATSALATGETPFAMWITTNATFAGDAFQQALSQVTTPLMFVADEVHNLGARNLRRLLPAKAQLRLGLSATPERYRDETGTAALADYFGDTVYSLEIHEAIERGILVPYRYKACVVEFESDELEEYVEITEKLAAFMARDGVDFSDLPPEIETLLYRRARLIGGARQKLSALKNELTPFAKDDHSLVYCNDSNVNGTETRQLDAAMQLLGNDMGMRVADYVSETSMSQRKERLQLFEEGKLNALVAIRCLDEGVDVPATRRAFILASSTNPRQYIQRRGRVLRRSQGKKRAEIFDFIVVPPEGALQSSLASVERRLVERELARVVEFARHAENGPAAMGEILPLQERYNLMHLG